MVDHDADAATKWRVKLYQLNGNLQWEERGVGHVSCAFNEHTRRMCIHVDEEDTTEVLLDTPILPPAAEEVYKKQQDTLLMWEEPDGQDLALSFQEQEGCDDLLSRILRIQAGMSKFSVCLCSDLWGYKETVNFKH